MPSEILPITNPNNPRSQPLLSSSETPILIGPDEEEDDIMPTTRLLISSTYDDYNKKNESEPFLSKSSSFSSALAISSDLESSGGGGGVRIDPKLTYSQQQRRRRIASESCLTSLYGAGNGNANGNGNGRQHSVREDVGQAAANTRLITRLSFTLLKYLGVGYRWITRFVALGCYSILLFPGFVRVGYYYFFSRQVRRGIVYGDQPRNRLDLYMPKDALEPKPVIAFVTGGAWIIGYKAWGSLLGQQLSERGIIVACIDYRNFPQGTMGDMVKDASQGISFICNNIAEYGGDPNRIYLMGQSAGAHIAACALVEQAFKEAEGERTSWKLSQIKAYFGLSGGYNLLNLVDYFHSRGLYRRLFLSIMEGEHSLARYSPELRVQEPNFRNVASLLPRIILFHGTADYSIPCDSSKSFAETLRGLGVNAESIMYEGKTHTDLFLQDPMRGGRDEMFEDLVAIIHEGDEKALAKDAKAPPRKRLVPEFMLQWARSVSPF